MSDEQNQEQQIDVEELQKKLDEAIKQSEANLNGWKRAQADFENYRKRKEAESKDLIEFAKEVTVTKLLPTIDTLEQALKHLPQASDQWTVNSEQLKDFQKQYQNWQKGIEGIAIQLDKVLEEMGVKKIQAVGQKFDPYKHEAVKEVESDKDDGIILDEFQTGFELNGKVIRPSQVIISKKKV